MGETGTLFRTTMEDHGRCQQCTTTTEDKKHRKKSLTTIKKLGLNSFIENRIIDSDNAKIID